MLVAALLLSNSNRWKVLAGIAAATTAASCLIHAQPLMITVALACVAPLGALLAAGLIRRAHGSDFALDRVGQTGTLVLAGLAAPLPGSLLVLLLAAAGGDGASFGAARAWWLHQTLGILIVAPPVVGLLREGLRLDRLSPWRAMEAVLIFGGIGTATALIFGDIIDPFLSVPIYVLPFILWAAFRFGPMGASTTVFIAVVVAMWNAAQGNGPFAMEEAPAASVVLRSQGAMVVATISFLMLASVVAERRRVAEENTVLVGQLRQALAEVKTLQGFLPICAWCHKVRDDAGFWQQIEMYLDAHTDATVSHSICPTCAAEAHDEVLEAAGVRET